MEIKFKNYIMRPDNGKTWALHELLINKKTGEEYEGNTIYPKSLEECLVHIRANLIKNSGKSFVLLSDAISEIENINKEFISLLRETLGNQN